jgi:hypothetical protein
MAHFKHIYLATVLGYFMVQDLSLESQLLISLRNYGNKTFITLPTTTDTAPY